jgi:starch phosphorylase
MATHDSLTNFADKVAIQLNDTHPAVAIPELMRLFIDEHGLDWDQAWQISLNTFSYTNHTLMSEALETWPVHLFQTMLPRLLQIILEINYRFLQDVTHRHPGDTDLVRRMSLIDEEGDRQVRMAHLAFVGSHKINGVAAIHTELMKSGIFADFHRFYPDRILNKTNGITPRRWLNQANRNLAQLISNHIGERWITDLNELRKLEPLAKDPDFQEAFRAVKRGNKQHLANTIGPGHGGEIDVESMFDIQVKRIHEYKRQLLNTLHVIGRYNRIRANPKADILPRTVIFAGKAAPGYTTAKLIIRLINAVADVVNHDPSVQGKLKILFLPNYNVSRAEVIIPAADLSEQISTAGTEASGTGNMKLALNGALTIGTRDGANIEIAEEVGEDNFFFFGLTASQVQEMRDQGRYDPWQYYHSNLELKQILDMISSGYFSPDAPDRFHRIVDNLTSYGDYYMLLADYASYVACQEQVDSVFRKPAEWTEKAILNVARMGKFSADRTVLEYAREIWGLEPLKL